MNRICRTILCFALLGLSLPYALLASSLGSSGGLHVPDPETLPVGEYEFNLYYELFEETNVNTGNLATTGDLTFVANAGIYDNLELGIRSVSRLNTPVGDQSFQITGKYRFPIDTYNVTLGGAFSTASPDWSTVTMTAGWKALWVGLGYNFGGRRLEEITRTQLKNVGFASFGGYNIRTGRNLRNEQTITGHPDTVFGLFGLNLKLSEQLRALADFNGDRFSAGFRLNIKDVKLDLSYISQGENQTLLDRRSQNVVVGAGLSF